MARSRKGDDTHAERSEGDAAPNPAWFKPIMVGLMLVGRHYAEETIYRAAAAFERSGDWTRF